MLKKKNIIIYAPSLRSDGGKIALSSFLKLNFSNYNLSIFINEENSELIKHLKFSKVYLIKKNYISRLIVEIKLFILSKKNSIVICFTNIPPLMTLKSFVVIFQQNLIILKKSTLKIFEWNKEIKFIILRLISLIFKRNVNAHIVQTQAMDIAIKKWYGQNAKTIIFPFPNNIKVESSSNNLREGFAYIAHGDKHKNHQNLLKAWSLLGKQGFKLKLILTLSPEYKLLADKIDYLKKKEGLEIYNLGHLKHEEVLKLYKEIQALIYPSYLESFAIPLLEASKASTPIIASELDYVREVCNPVETFDPSSPVSIARSVRRFINKPEKNIEFKHSEDFFKNLNQIVDGKPDS